MKYLVVKIFWFFINPLRKVFWFIFRPNTRGVKCLVENDGKFLLVKLNYAHYKWTIPGGRVKNRESFLNAAIRETKEETGINVINTIFIGLYKSNIEYKNDIIKVYFGNSDTLEIKIDPIEIKEAKWFSINELPDDHVSSVDRILEFYDKYKNP